MGETLSFPVNQLVPSLNSKDQILGLCKFHGPDLEAKFIENKAAFLFALAGKETSYGAQNFFKYEPAYGPGGLYLKRSKMLQDLYYGKGYGGLVCGSWGPWQILAITAIENQKFAGHPAELHNAMVSIPYVVGFLNYLVSKGADTIEKLAAAYNGGLGAIQDPRRWPKKYVEDFLVLYDSALSKIAP